MLMDMHRDPRVRALLVEPCHLEQESGASAFIADLQKIYQNRKGWGIWCWERAGTTRAYSDTDLRRLVTALGPMEAGSLATIKNAYHRFVGWFSLVPTEGDSSGKQIEIGARLIPEAWGNRLVPEMAEPLLDHAFDTLGAEIVTSANHPQNRSAHYCVMAMGFTMDGIRSYWGHGDAAHWQLSRAAWERAKRTPRAIRVRQALEALRHATIDPSPY